MVFFYIPVSLGGDPVWRQGARASERRTEINKTASSTKNEVTMKFSDLGVNCSGHVKNKSNILERNTFSTSCV